MSILDVFGFVFETHGADEVTDELKTLTKEEKAAEDQAKKLGKEQENLKKKNLDLAKSVASTIGAYLGFKKIIGEALNFAGGGEQLFLLAKSVGVATGEVERLGIALGNYGGSSSSAATVLANLNSQMQDLKFGKGGAIQEASLRYGLNTQGKNGLATGEEMLVNIAKRMESLNTMQQIDLGKKLGLDDATIALLQGGVASLNKELEKASKLQIYSKEDIENSRKFQMQLREFNLMLQKVWATASRAILPVLGAIMNVVGKIFGFLSDHKGFVLGLLAAVGAALTVIAIKSIIATAPFWLMVLAIIAVGVALGVLLDDFLTFLDGGESVIGAVIDWFKLLWNEILEIADSIANVFNELWDGLLAGFQNAFDGLVEIGNAIRNYFSNLWANIVAGFLGMFDGIVEKINSFKSWLGFGDEVKAVDAGKAALNSTSTPLSTMSTQNISNGGSNSVRIDNVQVVTQATDAKGISSEIGGTLSSEFENILYQNTSGVAA